jgi:signal transduction histidine kinase
LDILLLERELPAESRDSFISTIRQSVDRMFGIVQNFLDVNAIQRGAIVANLETIAVMPVVRLAVGMYDLAVSEKHIRIHTHIEGNEAAECVADKQLLLQVIDNLVSNAIKYSPKNTNVWVNVNARPPITRTATTVIEVRDEGVGILPEEMGRVFEKFARLQSRPTGGEHSTGLGLSIVKRLTETMKGSVRCESVYGKGATFIVELP